MAVIIPAAIGAVYSGYKIAHGIHQQNLANKAAAANQRPTYNIPQGEYDNLYMAENNASQGLDQGSKQIMTNNADRGLATSLNSVLRGGGDANAAGNIYDNYLNGISNITLMDNAQKIQNVNKLVASRNRMSDEQDKAWQINQYAPWADKAQQIAQQKSYGQQQIDSGIGSLASSGMAAAAGAINKGQVNDVNSTGKTSGGTSVPPIMRAALGGNAGNSFPNYGIDISKLNANDAARVNSSLYGNSVNFGWPVTGGMNEQDTQKSLYGSMFQ